MDNNFQDKEKIIEYLSVIRDAEVSKPAHKADKDLIEACVALLLDLQNKDADLTPEQINERVNKIPFVDTEKTLDIKTKKKKVDKFKLLLIAAIIPILITLLTLMAMADIKWTHFEKLKEMFGSIDKTPVGEVFYDNNIEFGKISGNNYNNIKDFSKDCNISVLIPGEAFAKNKTIEISCLSFDTGNEIDIAFETVELYYIIYIDKSITEIFTENEYRKVNINSFDCYIIDLYDVGTYQVYFEHNGATYCVTGSDSDLITDLIENLEELK